MFLMPRKARIVLPDSLSEGRALVFAQHERRFERPLLELVAKRETEGWLAAGSYVVMIQGGAGTTRIALLALEPGQEEVLPVPSPGWSLLLRVSSARSGRDIPEASVVVTEDLSSAATNARTVPSTLGVHGDPSRSTPSDTRTATSSHGLAAASGLDADLLEAHVSRKGFSELEVSGLARDSSGFLYRETVLYRAASLAVTVVDEAGAAVDATCSLGLVEVTARGAPVERDLKEVESNPAGHCQFDNVPAPRVRLTVRSGDSLIARRDLLVEEGQEHEELVVAAPISFGGILERADRPVPNAQLIFSWQEQPRSTPIRVATTESDDVGEFNVDLPHTGSYLIHVSPGSGWFRREILGDEFETLELGPTVSGTVVDQTGTPLPGADIVASYGGLRVMTYRTDSEGAFEFLPADVEASSIDVTAYKLGYEESGPQQVLEGPVGFEPLRFELEQRGELDGRFVGPDGSGVSGVRVFAYGVADGSKYVPLDESVSSANGRFRLAVSEESVRLFFGARDCPIGTRSVDRSGPGRPLEIECDPRRGGSVVLRMLSEAEDPLRGESILLECDGVAWPEVLLGIFLADMGLPYRTDGSGYLTLFGLSPASCAAFLERKTRSHLVAEGRQDAFLVSFVVYPGQLHEVSIVARF
jgi:hypothetical protein